MPALDWLVIANGEFLPREDLGRLAAHKAVLVLDGALAEVCAAGIQPQVVLGDFDSLDVVKEKRKDQSLVFVQDLNQETSDLEKGLCYLQKSQPASVTITNATGGRLDHTLYNLGLLKRFHGKFKKFCLLTAREQIFYLENQSIHLQVACPQPLALLAFPEGEVWSNGLKFEMQPLCLQLGVQESLSNTILAETASVEVKGGVLLMISHDTQIFF